MPVFLHFGHSRLSVQWSRPVILQICAYGTPDQAGFVRLNQRSPLPNGHTKDTSLSQYIIAKTTPALQPRPGGAFYFLRAAGNCEFAGVLISRNGFSRSPFWHLAKKQTVQLRRMKRPETRSLQPVPP